MVVVSSYLEHHQFNGKAALIVLIYTVFVSILVLQLKKANSANKTIKTKRVHYMLLYCAGFYHLSSGGAISGEYPLFL